MFQSTISLDQLDINPEEILSVLSLQNEPQTIFLSGSIIEGYGNTESDLDVFLVYKDEVSVKNALYNLGSVTISFEYVEDWRLDIESWVEEQIVATAQRINNCSPNDWNQCLSIDQGDILLGHRIRVGVPIREEDRFRQLQQTFDFGHLSRVISTRCLAIYEGLAEDVAGAIDSKQYGTALLTSRQALQIAIDAVLASMGETNIKEKWRFFKLDKLKDSSLSKRYWSLETQGIDTPEDTLTYAKECLLFANQLILKVQKTK